MTRVILKKRGAHWFFRDTSFKINESSELSPLWGELSKEGFIQPPSEAVTAPTGNISQIEGNVKGGIKGGTEQNVNTTQTVFPDITDSFYIAELYPLSLLVKSRIISLIFIFCGHTASQARQPRHAEGFLLSSRELRAMGALNPPPE